MTSAVKQLQNSDLIKHLTLNQLFNMQNLLHLMVRRKGELPNSFFICYYWHTPSQIKRGWAEISLLHQLHLPPCLPVKQLKELVAYATEESDFCHCRRSVQLFHLSHLSWLSSVHFSYPPPLIRLRSKSTSSAPSMATSNYAQRRGGKKVY